MYIFFQELLMFIILEMLRMIEGINKILNYLFGSLNMFSDSNNSNILDELFNKTNVKDIFNKIVLIGILVGGIILIISFVRNMILNNKSNAMLVSKFFVAIVAVFLSSIISLLIITITNEGFIFIMKIFNIDYNINIGYDILNICSLDYNNLYNINDIDFNIHSVTNIFGDHLYVSYQLFPIAWKNNGYINPNTFLYIPCLITTIIVMYVYLYSAIILGKRIYEIILLYLLMPIAIYTISLDDGIRLRTWISIFIKKVLITFSIYFSLFIFIILYNYLITRYITTDSYEMRILNLVLICAGVLIIPLSQKLIGILCGNNLSKKNITKLKQVFKENINNLGVTNI